MTKGRQKKAVLQDSQGVGVQQNDTDRRPILSVVKAIYRGISEQVTDGRRVDGDDDRDTIGSERTDERDHGETRAERLEDSGASDTGSAKFIVSASDCDAPDLIPDDIFYMNFECTNLSPKDRRWMFKSKMC